MATDFSKEEVKREFRSIVKEYKDLKKKNLKKKVENLLPKNYKRKNVCSELARRH